MLNEGQNKLLIKLEDILPKSTLNRKNKARSWKYGYNEDYDFVVISKDGTVGDIVIKALQAPLNALVTNSGHELLPDMVHDSEGFNALTGMYCNLRDEGVYDPVKVTKNSFIAAMSIASLFLTTEVAVLLPEE